MSNAYLAIEMIDLHPDERAELLKIRNRQMVERRWSHEKRLEKLASEFAMGSKHIVSILSGKLPY